MAASVSISMATTVEVMPTKPPSICPRCKTIKQGPCPKCNNGKSHNWTDDKHRGGRIQRGYDQDWIKLRAAKVAADPLCEYCLAKEPEVVTVAAQVHHRIPFRGINDPLRLDWDNLVSTCIPCHAVETGRKK